MHPLPYFWKELEKLYILLHLRPPRTAFTWSQSSYILCRQGSLYTFPEICEVKPLSGVSSCLSSYLLLLRGICTGLSGQKRLGFYKRI